MGHGVTHNYQHLPAAVVVVPPLRVCAARVIARVNKTLPILQRRIERGDSGNFPNIGKFRLVAHSAKGAGELLHGLFAQHQCHCAVGPAPLSSSIWPVSKRSSEWARLSACGSSWAMVCANTQPEAGVALKPP